MGLKISRRPGESIQVGTAVVFVRKAGNCVLLEVEAPADVKIVIDKTLSHVKVEQVDQDRSAILAHDRANAVRENSDHVYAKEQPNNYLSERQ